MDEQEFRRLLELFPAVRSPDYYLELDTSRQSTSQSKQKEEVKQLLDGHSKGSVESSTRAMDHGEAFWGKLKAAAEKKMGPAEAETFCKAFQQVYRKLVNEELSLEAARSLLNS
ncbi:uncharacterized protein LOC107796244 [Nicotiana tabacum]|uniref:Uncharacterized protein LOC107796244 n=1 Tax=Nicotiana tabacum TaxID=4097 RepID=A0A1S4ACV3_TOBAC|nr:uncharacterized protein LOC104120157 [Nicotiana tomentosiformis]XP_016474482.1 PREDICTED: uncharacterized protein LOC107796244 [Nicotiana tabacum]